MEETSIRLDAKQLRKLQLEMLSILVEFDRICRKHEIPYSLSCGTLLGAIRHKGFIPWDDDVDVEMPREAYERFCQVCPQEIDDTRFFFQTYETDPKYHWVYGKMRLKETVYIRPGQSHLQQKTGICIDVFALDRVPDHALMQRVMELITRACRKILWAPVGALRLPNWWQRVWFRALGCLSAKPVLSFFSWFTRLFARREVACLAFFNTENRTSRGYAYDKSWYARYLFWEFEGHHFPVPCGYHEILYLKYGDYMQLPKEEDRCGSSPAEYIRFSDGMEVRCAAAGGVRDEVIYHRPGGDVSAHS